MMWDFTGGSLTASPSVPMPVPCFPVPHRDDYGHLHSIPGPSRPRLTKSRAHNPAPLAIPTSFRNPDPDRDVQTHGEIPRGLVHFASQPPNHRRHPPQNSRPPPQRRQHVKATPLPVVHRLHAPPIPSGPRFQYSKCTGRRRALCIGINYRGQRHELRGCVNDAKHVFSFLVRRAGYKAENIVMLTDDSPYARSQPTRKNIIDAMRWLVRDARPHDSLFFHYSGHGGQTPDLDGDEVDGYDEVIYPVDYKRRGHIVDDEMHAIMVKPLPEGCRLTAVFDSCHSGTMLDLPYIYTSRGRLKGRQISDHARLLKATPADVISLSGCKDGQTSMDTFKDGIAVGAASDAFIKAFEAHPRQSYRELLYNIRGILHPKFSQKPQLGSSHPIDTSLRFIL
ncbi:caspase domain-containing protein [Mycena epipterygia]|nr:caspase domain-containing protein [Mycena epipterygia]